MIVLNVTYKCTPEQRDAFLKKLNEEGLAAACRAEEGNLKYDYYLPENGNGELLLVEKWRDAEALRLHTGLPHFKRIGEVRSELGIEATIEKFITE